MRHTNSISSPEGAAPKVFFMPGVFNETMELLADARHYFDEYGEEDQDSVDEHLRSMYMSEMSRITLRLSSIMAWIIAQRAVVAGKISPGDAAKSYGLDFQDICLVDNRMLHGVMPPYVCVLLDRTLELYERVQRLDTLYKSKNLLH